MSTQVKDGFWALSEKEKQTLRLIVRGHDAKSIARSLGLSVHTINERLRDARRKMAVSSSREAARLLLEAEGVTPDSLGDTRIGEDLADPAGDQGAGTAHRRSRILIGVALMTFALGLLALVLVPQISSPISATHAEQGPEVADAARQWLGLIDQGRWEDSYNGTGAAFRKLNTLQTWTAVSQKVRLPLGALVSRTLLSQQSLPAPPNGYEVIKFRARYANKAEVVETVTLEREDGRWSVVGVMVE